MVTTAAISSSAVPLTVWALLTVTVPVVALPTALRSVAATVPVELVMVINTAG